MTDQPMSDPTGQPAALIDGAAFPGGDRVPRVWFLSGDELAATRARVSALVERAARKGFTGRVSVAASPATRTWQEPGGLPVIVHGFDVTITGEPPRYAGWRFLAAVDAVDGGTVLRFPAGVAASVRNDEVVAGRCDHCHTRRARRSTVLVVHEDSGRVVQVGRSCLKDFLGHATLPVFLTDDEVTAEITRGVPGVPTAWDTRSVIAYAWAAVEAFGWTPTAGVEYGRTPTRDTVRLALAGGAGSGPVLAALAPHLADGARNAPGIIAALLAGLTETSGFQANLTAVLRGKAVEARQVGLAVSAIPAHRRLLEQQNALPGASGASVVVEHVGRVGEKVTVSGVVRLALRVAGFTFRSPDNVLLVVDGGTAVAKMTTAAAWAYQVHPGEPVTITGTVKAHTDWKGTKQTVLTRPHKIDPPADTLPAPPASVPTAPAGVPPVAKDAAVVRWERVDVPPPAGAAAERRAGVRAPAVSRHVTY